MQKITDFFLRPAHIIHNYRRSYLRPDLIAGLTVAVILIPQAIAYALIAELPPQVGLYSAIVASIVGGLWGSSHHLQTGPTNTVSLLVLSGLLAVAVPGTPNYLVAAGILALMVGVFSLVLGLARLGILVNFVSASVIVGFTAGAGVLILINQLRHLLRLNVSSSPELTETLRQIGIHIPESHWPSLLLGAGTILTIWLLRRTNSKLPGPLIAMVASGIVVGSLGLGDQGIKIVGELPHGLPPFNRLFEIDFALVRGLSTKAFAVTAIGLVETTSIARVIASQTRQRLDSNQEFIGQGLANIFSGIFSGYPTAGSFTRSVVNHQSGARTSLSNVFAGIIVFIAMLSLAGLAAFIPLASLAGVLILMATRLIDHQEIKRIWHGPQGDRAIMVVTFTATLLIPLEYAVLLGIMMSVVSYLLQTSSPRVRTVQPDADFEYFVHGARKAGCPQLGIIEILGDLYFGAVHHIEECIHQNIEENPHQRYLLLRMHDVDQCDISGIHALEHIVDEYRHRNGDVFISRYREPVLDVMHSTGFYESLGADHFLSRDHDAIGLLFHKVLDPVICIYECPYRVFSECQNLPKRLDVAGVKVTVDLADQEIPSIGPRNLWKELHSERPPLLIDVREPREYKHGHIPEARLIPLPKLCADTTSIPSDRPVVLLCWTGRRSTRALCLLHDKGYKNVMILKGGMQAWEAANLLEAID